MKRNCTLFLSSFLSFSIYFYPMELLKKEEWSLKMPILYSEEVVQSLKKDYEKKLKESEEMVQSLKKDYEKKLKESEEQLNTSYLYQDLQADLILLTNTHFMRQIIDLTNLKDSVGQFIKTSEDVITYVEEKDDQSDIILKQKIEKMKTAIAYIRPTVSK